MKLWTFILATALSLCALSCPLQAENYVSRKYKEIKATPSEAILVQKEAKKLSKSLKSQIEAQAQLDYAQIRKLYEIGIFDVAIRKYVIATKTKIKLTEKQEAGLKKSGATDKTIDALKPKEMKKDKSKN